MYYDNILSNRLYSPSFYIFATVWWYIASTLFSRFFCFVSFPGIRLCYSFSRVWCPHRSVWIFIELARRNCTGASTIIYHARFVTQRHPSRLWGWIYFVIWSRFTPEKCYKNKSNKVQLKPLLQRVTTQKLYTHSKHFTQIPAVFFENPTKLKIQ